MSTNVTNPLDLPAMAAPAGVTPNFSNPPNDNPLARGVLITGIILSTIAIATRVSTTWFVLRKVFWGDFVLIAGYGSFMASISFVLDAADNPGMFIHQWDLLIRDIIPFLHSTFLAGVIFGPSLALIKSAILLEWVRIFAPMGTRNLTFWFCHVLMWINLVFYSLMVILLCIACTPIESIWDPLVPGTCRVNMDWTELSSSLVNFITDVLIFLIPQRAIWKLNMAKDRKLGVAAVFGVGFLGIIATAIRVYYTAYVTTEADYTYAFSRVLMCALAEGTCAMIVVCGTTLPRGIAALTTSKLAISLRSFLQSLKAAASSKRSASGPSELARNTWPAERLSDEAPQQASGLYTDTDVPLQTIIWTTHGSSQSKDAANQPETGGDSGIFRSTRFEASEVYDVDGTMDGRERHRQINSQHPWKEMTH